MTLPASGSISTDQIMAELRTANPGRAYPLRTSDSDVIALAGKNAGQTVTIPNDFWGRSAAAFAGYISDVQLTAPANPPSSTTVSGTVTATFAGGAAPFSYAWSTVSGQGSVDATNSQSSTARMTNPRFSEPGTVMTQVVQCVITDSTGKTLTLQGNVTLTLG